MKLVRHADETIVAIIERGWEKAYLTSLQGQRDWEPVFLIGNATPIAEIHTTTHQVRLCEGQHLAAQCDVVLHDV